MVADRDLAVANAPKVTSRGLARMRYDQVSSLGIALSCKSCGNVGRGRYVATQSKLIGEIG